MEITLIVMAAGMGSRYGGLKQVDGFGPHGETLLEYSVYDAIRAGFDRVVFVIRPDIEDAFNACLPPALTSSIDTQTVFQTYTLGLPEGLTVPPGREKPWGTGQAVLAAREVTQGPFAVINADDFYGKHAFQSMATFLRGLPSSGESVASALVGYRLKHTLSDYGSVSRGLCEVNASRELLSIAEAPTIKRSGEGIVAVNAEGTSRPLDGDAWVSMNFWGFAFGFWPVLERAFYTFLKTKAQDIKAEFYLPLAVDAMLKQGEGTAKLLPCEDSWLGITYREEAPAVRLEILKLIEAGAYPKKLWSASNSALNLVE